MTPLSPLRTVGRPLARAVVERASGLAPRPGHPLAPAAVRVERTKARRRGEVSEQTAVTLWFGQGPQLPPPGLSRSPWRVAAGLGVTLVGAAALAAASTLVAQREEARRLESARLLPSLPPGAAPATTGPDSEAGTPPA